MDATDSTVIVNYNDDAELWKAGSDGLWVPVVKIVDMYVDSLNVLFV